MSVHGSTRFIVMVQLLYIIYERAYTDVGKCFICKLCTVVIVCNYIKSLLDFEGVSVFNSLFM